MPTDNPSSDANCTSSSNTTLDDIYDTSSSSGHGQICIKGIKSAIPEAIGQDVEAAPATDDDVTECITLVTNYLRQDSLYLPAQTTRELVTWLPENRSHRLV
jgi:hypothetical protein